jgi:diguanylate cyclase (GGDEF)-like protein
MNPSIDELTGLLSGETLYDEAEALIAKGGDFALVSMDMDGLFVMNRDFGHAAGDAVIHMIARHIKDLFPDPCLAFRKGDEFNVLTPDGKEEAFLKAEQLRRLISEEKLDFKSADGAPLTQSVSVGVASFPDDGSRFSDVYRRADSAMVRAKNGGRNRVFLAKEEKLIPKTSHYTQTQLEKLSLISEQLGVGEAALLREALDHLLRRYDEDDIR